MRAAPIILFLSLLFPGMASADCVVLLHGLARTAGSMERMADAFRDSGYQVVNVDYPSTQQPIEELAPLAIGDGLQSCPPGQKVHFVTHSLGGILVRYYMSIHEIPNLGRVVMLAPPNQGSQVADHLKDNFFYQWLNGPAGGQLGTQPEDLAPQLDRVDFELGVIAGTKSVNPRLSQLLPNPDDGKVSVENTKVEGMTDFIQVPHSHTFMMQAKDVIEQALHFIAQGSFQHAAESDSPTSQPWPNMSK